MGATQSELRLARLIDEREITRSKHESMLAAVEAREDKTLSETEVSTIKVYREKAADLDVEIKELADEIKRYNDAVEQSKALRRAMTGTVDGVDIDGDGVVYRTFAAYARDVILTDNRPTSGKIASLVGQEAVQRAAERLQLIKRTPANTLSSDVEGLQPAQHIAQIMQVIDTNRPLVASANRDTLERGQITYPSVTQRPIVAVQAAEKTEAGNQKMIIDMETANASVYLGGGDLSWQAVNWSTPNALDTWFRLAAADYALKTEQDAAQALQHSAFTYNISSTLGSTPTFADFMVAVGAGASDVFTNSGRMANTVYLSVDRYWYLFGTTSTAAAQFTTVTGDGVGPLRFVASRGLDAGVIVVGDRDGLLVAETAGAPVELRVTEPAIGGYEVGIIGGFEAVVTDPGAFAMITTAS